MALCLISLLEITDDIYLILKYFQLESKIYKLFSSLVIVW